MVRSSWRWFSSCLLGLAVVATPLPAEFLSFEVEFEDSGCIPCTQSLETRLGRTRGVEKVTVDLGAKLIRLELGAGNRVRLGPLRARISQDGTKIRGISFEAIGDVSENQFTPTGLTHALPLAKPLDDMDSVLIEGRLVGDDKELLVDSVAPSR